MNYEVLKLNRCVLRDLCGENTGAMALREAPFSFYLN